MTWYSQATKTFANWIAISLFSIVLLLQALNIFLRYTTLASPLMWVEEFSRFAFIWILFLLWHVADREGAHFPVDFLHERLSNRGRKRLDVLTHSRALMFSIVVLLASVRFIPTTMLYATNSFAWLPMGVIYLVIPAGFILVAIERLRLISSILRS